MGKQVTLCGWANKYRNLGALHFIDIRDKYGITQLGFDQFPMDLTILKNVSLESVLLARGKVGLRPKEAQNARMPTGEIEVQVIHFEILSSADKDTIPFLPSSLKESHEDLRLQYRYLDLRSKRLQEILSIRSQAMRTARDVLYREGFVEVETPILYKSTPEGARDYIVPGRLHPGKVYALAQSPQIPKQLLMIGGVDKYFQFARCFRDEDLRADRQPEFSQLDIEVSFATPEYMKKLVEAILIPLYDLPANFELSVLSYARAMGLYGTDRPDIRFALKQRDVTELFKESDFSLFSEISKTHGLIKALFLPQSKGQLSRKEVDALGEVVRPYGGKGVAWFKVQGGHSSGGISKFITHAISRELTSLEHDGHDDADDGMWFFIAHKTHSVAHACADALRRYLGQKFQLHLEAKEKYSFLWVDRFPLLQWDEEQNRYFATHHPFTMPSPSQLDEFMNPDSSHLLKDCLSQSYDVVCNGYEIAGGSIRIHNRKVQERMFEVLGMGQEEVEKKFDFLLKALSYGAPPHGGVAFGLDRHIMLLAQTDNIRDVIAFPKTTSAQDLCAGTPSPPEEWQTRELHFNWRKS